MLILLVGGTGFIGTNLAIAIAQRGHSVRLLAAHRDPNKVARNSFLTTDVLFGSLHDLPLLNSALRNVDVVVHLACSTIPQLSNEAPLADINENLIGTLNLLTVARQSGIKKIVFASSGGTIYGPTSANPIPESHSTDPICSYGITKLAIEKYLGLFNHLYGLDYVVLRLANPFGEFQNPSRGQGAIAVFIDRVIRRKSIQVWGDGTVARDYFYVGDAVDAFIRAIESQTPSRIYNIGSGLPRSITEVLTAIGDETGVKPIVEYSEGRKVDIPVNCLDISKASDELNWSPRVSFHDGIRRTISWLQAS